MRYRRDGEMVGERIRSSIKMAIIGTMQLHDVRKLNQKDIAYKIGGGVGSVKSVSLNSIASYFGKEGNIPLPSAVVHTLSRRSCCVHAPVLHVKDSR